MNLITKFSETMFVYRLHKVLIRTSSK